MAKMTKTQFAEKWKTGVCVPKLYELKTCSAIAKVSPNGTFTRHNYTNEDNGKTAYLKYKYLQNGLYLKIQCSIFVDSEIYNSGWITYAKVNATKISFDYDVLDDLYEEISDEINDIDGEEFVNVKLTKNANGLWDVLLPEGYEYGTIRREDTESVCSKVSVGITVIKIGDSSVELELHENDNGRTVVAIIQDGNAAENDVRNIVGELADFFGCTLQGIEVRKGGDDE